MVEHGVARQQASAWHQFSLRVLIEMIAVCCIVAAAQQLNHLLAMSLSFGVVAVWAIRMRDWRMQFSLMTLFGGISSVLLGMHFVVEGFRLAPLVRYEHRLPELLVSVGPVCVIMGGFWASFGLVHMMFLLAESKAKADAGRPRT